MASPPSPPAHFLRLFLSHLVVVLLCLVAGLILVDYLFAEGLRYFRQHSPLILIPVLLGLIGLAGLLALWTSAVITIPVERLTEVLRSNPGAGQLGAFRDRAGCEEHAALIDGVIDLVARYNHPDALHPFTLIIDPLLNIRGGDISTAARLGMLPSELEGLNLRALIAKTDDARDAIAWVRSAKQGVDTEPRRIAMRAAGGVTIRPLWRVLLLPSGDLVLTGTDARPVDSN